MNTPTIASVLPSAQANPARASGSNDADNNAGPTFSDVLTNQQASASPKTEATTAQGAAGSKTNRPAAEDKEQVQETPDALAQLAGEQGLTLPQIALSMAAHAISTVAGTNDAEKGALADAKTALPKAALLAQLDRKTTTPNTPATAKEPVLAAPLVDKLPGDQTKLAATKPDAVAINAFQNTIAKPATGAAQPSVNRVAPLPGAARADSGKTQPRLGGDSLQSVAAQALHTAAPGSFTISAAPDLNLASDANQLNAMAAGLGASGQNITAGSNNPQALQAASQLTLTTPFQSPQWANDFGRQITAFTLSGNNQNQTAELRLDPPELGPIRISININDHVAQAMFVSPHSAVRNAVENALPALAQQLAQAGISLGQTSVSDHGQSDNMFDQSGSGKGKSFSMNTSDNSSGSASSTQPAAVRNNAAANALVDTFA